MGKRSVQGCEEVAQIKDDILVCQRTFLGADDYRLQPMDNPPLASFDQDANDNEELLILEDFIPLQNHRHSYIRV